MAHSTSSPSPPNAMSDRPSKDYPDTENRVSLQRLLVVFINGLYVKKSLQDVYIAVMGLTGSGKSTFINLASQARNPLRVGHGLRSCTNSVEPAEPFVMDGRRIHFYDTPGFDDTAKTETQILHMIAAALEVSFRKGIVLHGVIYVHRITDNRVGGLAKADFGMFRKMCGAESLQNVVIMTTMWSRVSEEEGQARAEELAELDDFFKPALEAGARLAHHKGDTVQTARNIIRPILDNHPIPLELQDDMVNKGKPVTQTEAGKEVDKHVTAVIEEYEEKIKHLMKEREDAERAKDVAAKKEKSEAAAAFEKKIIELETEKRNAEANYAQIKQQADEAMDGPDCGCTIM